MHKVLGSLEAGSTAYYVILSIFTGGTALFHSVIDTTDNVCVLGSLGEFGSVISWRALNIRCDVCRDTEENTRISTTNFVTSFLCGRIS